MNSRWWEPALAPTERPAGTPRWAALVDQAAHRGPGDLALVEALVALADEAGGVDPGVALRQRLERLTAPVATLRPLPATDLRRDFPVLARLLGHATDAAIAAHAELLARLGADRDAVVATLLDGVEPGPVVGVAAGQGDTHAGRSVAIVTFADGRRVVYKPRDLAPQRMLSDFLRWLNRVVPGLDTYQPPLVLRPGYGWMGFVARCDLATGEGLDRFYRRLGAQLAVLHLLRVTDLNGDNVIACADQPVLIDAEAMFHPLIGGPADGDPAGLALGASVHRTGLLPRLIIADDGIAGAAGVVDISGLGGVGANRPRVSGAPELATPEAYEPSLIEGFRIAYEAMLRHRDELAVMIGAGAGVPTRVVHRSTADYVLILDGSLRPDLLRSGADRDRYLAAAIGLAEVGSGEVGSGEVGSAEIGLAEIEQLRSGDVPIFVAPVDPARLAEAQHTLLAMSEAHRQDQEWIISATLATRRPDPGHDGDETADPGGAGRVADADTLLAAACGLGDLIMARAHGDAERVNWLGLEDVDDRQWLVLPLGAGLAHGFLGVALFLAQLTDLTGIGRFHTAARRAVAALPALCADLARRGEAVAAVGCGGLYGFGGIAYGLARLSTLLADERLRDSAEVTVWLAARAADADAPPGFADGLAGCLTAMRAVDAEIGSPGAVALARHCERRLAGTRSWPIGDDSFLTGRAGVAWAMAGLDAVPPWVATPSAGRYSGPAGWCRGAAGLVLAETRSGSRRGARPGSVDEEWFTHRPPLRDLSLCHGELGVVEALTVLAARPGADAQRLALARDRRAGLVLEALGRHGPTCGTPGGVTTPGLLTGLAGIGYGLLRAGLSTLVPSILLLEPTPRAPANGNHR